MKVKKDRLFIIILAIVAGSLAYDIMWMAIGITSGTWTNLSIWLLLLAKSIGLTGILWLLRTYRKSRKISGERK